MFLTMMVELSSISSLWIIGGMFSGLFWGLRWGQTQCEFAEVRRALDTAISDANTTAKALADMTTSANTRRARNEEARKEAQLAFESLKRLKPKRDVPIYSLPDHPLESRVWVPLRLKMFDGLRILIGDSSFDRKAALYVPPEAEEDSVRERAVAAAKGADMLRDVVENLLPARERELNNAGGTKTDLKSDSLKPDVLKGNDLKRFREHFGDRALDMVSWALKGAEALKLLADTVSEMQTESQRLNVLSAAEQELKRIEEESRRNYIEGKQSRRVQFNDLMKGLSGIVVFGGSLIGVFKVSGLSIFYPAVLIVGILIGSLIGPVVGALVGYVYSAFAGKDHFARHKRQISRLGCSSLGAASGGVAGGLASLLISSLLRASGLI